MPDLIRHLLSSVIPDLIRDLIPIPSCRARPGIPFGTSLTAYIQFACWHTSVEYESPHKKKLNELLDKCPIFRADFKPSMDFSKTLMDYSDNIPIWSRLGYSYKEFYLKFGQPDPSTFKPSTNSGVSAPSTLRRNKTKK